MEPSTARSRLQLPAVMDSLRPLTEFVLHGARTASLAEADLGRLDLVLEEILVNVIRYAYPAGEPGSVEVDYTVEGTGQLWVQVSDKGREFDPLAADPPDLSRGLADRPIGGLGIFLVKSIAESITYCREGDRNILAFRFHGDPGKQ